MFYCDVLTRSERPPVQDPSPALFAAKYIYYKQNFLVVKLLECFKLCSLRPCAPQTATVARQANILNLEIISCYVLDILRNYLSLS